MLNYAPCPRSRDADIITKVNNERNEENEDREKEGPADCGGDRAA